MSSPFEKPTDELRQVRKTIEYVVASRPLNTGMTMDVVTSVQRKWLVQVGESFLGMITDDRPSDIVIVGASLNSPPGVVRVAHTREEWRDLPVA